MRNIVLASIFAMFCGVANAVPIVLYDQFNQPLGTAGNPLKVTGISGVSSGWSLDGSTTTETDLNVDIGGTLNVAGSGDSSFSGMVGIGTASPDTSLTVSSSGTTDAAHFHGDVNGYYQALVTNTNAGASASADYIASANVDGNTQYVDLGINGTGMSTDVPFVKPLDGYVYSSDSTLNVGAFGAGANISFTTGTSTSTGATRMTIANAGNVGINTISPGYSLDITGTTRSTGANTASQFIVSADGSKGAPVYRANDQYTGIYFVGNSRIGFSVGNDDKLSVGANVGIGTISPVYKLQVIGTMRVSGETSFDDLNTGSNAGTDLCVDAQNKLCACGTCG